MSSNIFLDNNICIAWLLKDNSDIYKYVNDKIIGSNAYISRYVLSEFIRIVVWDNIALLSILDGETDLDHVKTRIYSIYENGNDHDKRVADRYIMYMSSIKYPREPDIDYAKYMIKFYAKCSIKLLKKKINILDSKVNCELSYKKPRREGLKYKIEIPCKKNISKTKCSILDYISDEIDFLNLIDSKISGREDFENLHNLILTINSCSVLNCCLKHCKIMGDVIILNDCPNDFTMVSKDHHFEKLCDITDHTLKYFGK